MLTTIDNVAFVVETYFIFILFYGKILKGLIFLRLII